ncbi:nucleotide-diphospho-sugar transferase [Nitzschia inconspicua]|uniref:Nucleotide-diphospho-sugar transferase n=1 Tax=Nitzschia inconspicua TaxID=303405 RepID=A0A9K3LE60_9STRA|nr:nucleotide-diphospho-sugar transferase [Nitzschia inconspicua]KAG7359346.1 nucleotide-diphospho-sugar transferase [Nitzschia inconspicua]
MNSGNSNGHWFSMLKIFLLLTILAHGIMFSLSSLGSIGIPSIDYTANAPSDHGTVNVAVSSMWNNNYNNNNNGATIQSSSTTSKTMKRLPHWRVAVDCSAYSLDCFSRGQRNNRYLPYPFPPKKSNNEFQTEILRKLPEEWSQRLQSQPITNYSQSPEISIQDKHNLYPPMVGDDEYKKCLEFTGIIQGTAPDEFVPTKSTVDQLDEILASGRLTVEPDTNMVAFTISDSSYTRDMLHDMFQMMDHVVGFSPQHFFIVAIDIETLQMACRYGYPVLFWKESNNETLRDAVANTKLLLSFELVNRGIDFFFSEMDVWWIKSPKSSLQAFQDVKNADQTIRNYLYFSGHQNNPGAANIGVYAAKATNQTKEYFQTCLDLLKQRPKTHDQLVMQQVGWLYESTLNNKSYGFGGNWGEEDPPPVPPVRFPFKAKFWGPHDIVADERPMPTLETMAIHTLCGVPLLNPHGKKMIAREIGAYYGFVTDPSPNFGQRFVYDVQKSTTAAGYYARAGNAYRRYLVLDSSLRTSFYSTSPAHIYYRNDFFEWIVAVLLTIAKWSDRIFILPQVFMAYMDAGSYFSWNVMDYSMVNDFIDTRECNFLSNPKSWANDDEWPFVSAAVTAFLLDEESKNATIYSQVTNRSEIISQHAWEVGALAERNMLDAYAASLLYTDTIQDTELLLVNPDFMLHHGFIDKLAHRSRLFRAGKTEVSRFERDVFDIYEFLGWCWESGREHSVSKTSASHSCYAKGQNGRR